jgi:rod shape determining protein RodA
MINSNRKVSIFDYDWISIVLFLLLVLIGITSIYSTEYTNLKEIIFENFYFKQIVWAIFSLFLIVLIGFIPVKNFKNYASLIYLIVLFSLVLVLIIGAKINGNRSWFRIGSFGLQPAEFMKLAAVLGLAKLITDIDFNVTNIRDFLKATLLIMAPVVLILLQPDLGSAIVFLSLFIVLYREGVDLKYFMLLFTFALLFILTIYWGQQVMIIILFSLYLIINILSYYFLKKKIIIKTFLLWMMFSGMVFLTSIVFNHVLKPHQKNRIEIVLGKKKDDRGTGYNLKQGLIAIGSGGLTGKGLDMSTQTKGYYIPAQPTDWIFTVIGERWGFLGSISVVILFVVLLLRLVFLAERQKDKFVRVVGYGVVSIILIHFALNLLMVLGLFPTIGIPLPFISYGGSSLWAFTLMLFIFLKLDAHRKETW